MFKDIECFNASAVAVVTEHIPFDSVLGLDTHPHGGGGSTK